MDARVNTYPMHRSFTAVGHGDDEFVTAMRVVVESVLTLSLDSDSVRVRASSKGTYVSVTLGPVPVRSPDQVLEVMRSIKADPRVKFYM